MAEPGTTTAAAAASTIVGLASLFPGIDGNALIGAFAGAVLVVVTSKDLSLGKRFAYLVISLVVGYLGAPEIVNQTPIASTGVAAFFAAALAIAVALQLIERVKTLDLRGFKKGG
ncbi:putative holin [Cupriavidus sp. UGS-1]|uniref:putative holin n=1 Tax=Cupriavidus sp. UGS-1 TaxID=2899826 RepID=UPI001E4675BD|nr:putative holin [Cupriavidus sp. UGS-1]MCD9124027.1 phage holin family protein [Cupriavidus sp. UGS-1]